MCAKSIAAALLIGTFAFAAPASATTLTLAYGNSAIADYPAPYGTITVEWLSPSPSQAMITLQGDTREGYTYLFGDGSTIALNTNGTATVGTIIEYSQPQTNPATPVFSQTSPLPAVVDGWGAFNFVLDDKDGYKSAVSSMTFLITKDTGTWSSADDVLIANEQGLLVAAHVFVTLDGGATNGPATGFATNGDGPVPVPEPGSLAMIALGAAGLAAAWRRRRRH